VADGDHPRRKAIYYFVDEAGDGTLFDARGRILVGSPGCSRFFILGKLDVDDPAALTGELESLRRELLGDPYFRGVPSMQADARRTAIAFHAKDDPAEVRREVFRLLCRRSLRFYAVVRDKRELAAYVREQNARDASYRYRPDELYDTLVRALFGRRWTLAHRFEICFARRGARNRNARLHAALQSAAADFEREFGVASQAETSISVAAPAGCGGLQAVDYFLWAVQRYYDRGEQRYIELIWPQVAEVNDLDLVEDGHQGVRYRKDNPVWLADRGENEGREI